MKTGFKTYRPGVFYKYLNDRHCHVWGRIPSLTDDGTKYTTTHEYVPPGGDVLAALVRVAAEVEQARSKTLAERREAIEQRVLSEVRGQISDMEFMEQVRKRVEAERTEALRQRAANDVHTALQALGIDKDTVKRAYQYHNVYGQLASNPFVR
jgi:hypothetical protein